VRTASPPRCLEDGEGHFVSRAEFGRGGLHSSPKNPSPEHAPQ